ncbi:hypothetical protein SAMN05444920_104734 [Nonomuraea solani]|uniref:Uncharacterized protein n=1 Tax=Nonomuraea solani TaxID=1144553 RepID=A0A1H6D4D4_9ACTN|nr:hypothetical protein [Nonomuraea solani]SEG79663.1 hypothetical protein SAMN05444920_104734 [Nonomuraea solani]
MSSPDQNAPKTETTHDERPAEPKPAGRHALERALSEAGKDLEDLTR